MVPRARDRPGRHASRLPARERSDSGTPLDAWPNEFFTEDGRYLICVTHGAVFAPETGICLGGPCPGARLEPLSVTHRGGELVVSLAP